MAETLPSLSAADSEIIALKKSHSTNEILSAIITDKNKINYTVFAEYAIKKYHPVTFNETVYICNEDTCLYEEDRGTVQEWLQSILEDVFYSGLSQLSESVKFQGVKNEVYNRVLHHHVFGGNESPFNLYNGFPVNNGVIVFDSEGKITFENYKPEMLFTHKIPVDYDPDADMTHIIDILQDWLGDDYNYLIQIPAQAIVQALPNKTPMRKAYLLIGEASSGKTTFLHLLEKIFGEKNISSVGLHNLAERFNTSTLVGKFLNAADDIPSINFDDAGTFKTIVGRRLHDVEEKHKQRYMAEITAVHIYTANKPPQLTENVDRDDAWWDRWVILRFLKTFKKVANWSEIHFTAENLKGFLKAGILLASQIIKDGGALPFEQEMSDVRQDWRYESSPLNEFMEENTELMQNGNIPKEEFFDALWDWVNCYDESDIEKIERKNRTPTTITALTQKLLREGIESKNVRKKGHTDTRVYTGIRWNPSSKYNKVETKNGSLI